MPAKKASKPVAGKLRSKSKKPRWRGDPTTFDQDLTTEQEAEPPKSRDRVTDEGSTDSKIPSKPHAEQPARKDPAAAVKRPETTTKTGAGAKQRKQSKGRRKPVDLMADTAEVDAPATAPDAAIEKRDERAAAEVADQPSQSSDAKDAAFAAMSATASEAETKGPVPADSTPAGGPPAQPDTADAQEPIEAELVAPAVAGISAETAAQVPKSAPPHMMEAPAPTVAASPAGEPPTAPAPLDETAPATEPEPPPQAGVAPAPPPVGIIHPPSKRLPVYYLSAGLAGVAAVSLFPAVREVLLHFTSESSPGIDLWAPIVMLLGLVQLAYVAYAVQLPDWGTTRVMMVLSVVIAMFYAMVLGISVMAKDDNSFVLSLGLTSEYHLKQITAWCFLMLVLMCTLAYFWARTTFRWRRTGATGLG